MSAALDEHEAQRVSYDTLSREDLVVCLDALSILRHSRVPGLAEHRDTYQQAFEALGEELLRRDVLERRGGANAGLIGELQALGKYPPPHMRRRRNELIREAVGSGLISNNRLARLIDMSPGQISRIVNHISPVREDR